MKATVKETSGLDHKTPEKHTQKSATKSLNPTRTKPNMQKNSPSLRPVRPCFYFSQTIQIIFLRPNPRFGFIIINQISDLFPNKINCFNYPTSKTPYSPVSLLQLYQSLPGSYNVGRRHISHHWIFLSGKISAKQDPASLHHGRAIQSGLCRPNFD